MQYVKISPDVALAALRHKRDQQFRLWSLSRACDGPGRGLVVVEDLAAWIVEQDDGVRGLSAPSIRRLLKAGEGVFWTTHTHNGRRRIKMHGLLSVAVALGVKKLRADPVLLPMRYARSLRAWRASIYASQFNDDFGSPISRRTIETITGRTARSQRYYQVAMGGKMDRRQNASFTGKMWQHGDDIPDGHYPDYVNNELVLLKRLPNSYRSHLRRGPRGMMRRVNSQLNARNSFRISGEEERQRGKRVFYSEQRAAQRRIQALDEGDQFLVMGVEMDDKAVSESRCGAMLYSRWAVADGRAFFA